MPIIRNDVRTIAAGETSRDSSIFESTKEVCEAHGPDLLRRFTSTPHSADMQLMGRTVRVETNSKSVLELVRSFFVQHQVGTPSNPEFLWRIVCESDGRSELLAPPVSGFSEPGLQYANLGLRGFLAVDLEIREAAAFLSEQFINGEARFRHRPPLDALFCMTASSLGLTALSGGSVGRDNSGVLVFGPPNSGKTTACYLAARGGMEFHADQVVFVDMKGGLLRAWGDLLPAVFRPETTGHLPELLRTARHSTYEGIEFYYVDKAPFQGQQARPLHPICGLFLNRNASCEKELTRVTAEEAVLRLRDCLLFEDDARFDEQVTAALSALAEIPIYNLRYGEDPQIAATVIQGLLS